MSSKVVINGVAYTGNSISIRNGKVTVDGKDVSPDSKTVHVSVEGDIDALRVDACERVVVTGSVRKLETASGDVDVQGDVQGPVTTVSGDVQCSGKIEGAVRTVSGDIRSGG